METDSLPAASSSNESFESIHADRFKFVNNGHHSAGLEILKAGGQSCFRFHVASRSLRSEICASKACHCLLPVYGLHRRGSQEVAHADRNSKIL